MHSIVPVFHRWIREDAVPGLLIDVADYKHVVAGPGIILIGHDVDYALDMSHGRAGFLTRRKRLAGGTVAENLQSALDWAIMAAQQFQQDTGLALHGDDIEITFPDRLHAPNNEATFAIFREEALTAWQNMHLDATVVWHKGAADERRPLVIQATIPGAATLAALTRTAVAV